MTSSIARRAAVLAAVLALGGCDKAGEGAASTSKATTSAAARKSCAGFADCANGDVCWFEQAGCGADVRGTCGPQDPPCYVAYPFCGCSGHTYYGCSRPPASWSRKGECSSADAGSADGGK